MKAKISNRTEELRATLADKDINFGQIRTLAKEIKKDHHLALELWSTGHFPARQLAILIMDKKLLTEEVIDRLIEDISQHDDKQKLHLTDWLMANQLVKDKSLIALMERWLDSPSSIKRRIYWYYQGRIRWMGKIQPNSQELLEIVEERIESEAKEVQWAMNFTTGWIGVFEKEFRKRCIAIGKETGLFKGQMVSKGCTPDYLPEFISMESAKRGL